MTRVMVGAALVMAAAACNPAPAPTPQYGTPQPQGGAPPSAYGAPPQTGGSAGCVDVLSCYGRCPGLAQDCTSQCDASGTPAAVAANAEIFRCIAANQCQDEGCITSRCAAQLQTCTATPGAAIAQAAPPPAQGAPSAMPAVSDAEFVFKSQNGLEYVPELNVVAQGVPVLLDGTWADTKRNFTLELRGNTYVATSEASSAYFRSGSRVVETGTWSLSGTSFTVTPGNAQLATANGLHQEGEGAQVDPPRAWTLVGATLEFIKFGDPSRTVHRVDGLVLGGQAPSWDSVGAFGHVLRRSR